MTALLLPVLAQMGGAVPSSPAELVGAATTVTKVVLVLLAVLSLVSWAAMFAVGRAISAAQKAGGELVRDIEMTAHLDDAAGAARRARPSAFTRLFTIATGFASDTRLANAPAGSQVEVLRLILEMESSNERDRIGRFLPLLATIGSASPLIGLLGTVLGVIEAFIGIARSGSGNLAAVAPGVAEALIATAAALIVAIPATFAYNILAGRLNRVDGLFDSFSTALISLLVREGRI